MLNKLRFHYTRLPALLASKLFYERSYVLHLDPVFSSVTRFPLGARGGTVGSGTALQAGRSQVRFPMVSLEFFIDIILPTTLWPWGLFSL